MQIVEVLTEYANRSLNRPFSYFYKGNDKLEKGIRVLVNFNHRDIVGYVINVTETNKSIKEIEEESGYQINEIVDVIDKSPLLNEELLSLFIFVFPFFVYISLIHCSEYASAIAFLRALTNSAES